VAGLAIAVGYFAFLFVPVLGWPSAPWSFLDKREITLENRTPYYVTIYVDGQVEAVLEPNETETIKDFKFLWVTDRPVEAVDREGRVLYSANLDDDDLERMDYRIVLEEP
jgi:hypothetical protein